MDNYKKYLSNGSFMIFSEKNNLWISPDNSNVDYQEYLSWLAEGNEPEIIDLSE